MPADNGYNTQKADPKTRKLIRSHVMQGKNRVKTSRKTKNTVDLNAQQVVACTDTDPFFASCIPRLLCSQFAAISFAADVEPSLIQDILLFGSMSSETMFLLNSCIKPATPDDTQIWFAPMLFDAAYLHAACFTIQSYYDRLLARTPSADALQRNRMHYAKAIRMLRERLAFDNDSVKVSDSTIWTILSLSGQAYTVGDFESADYHTEGFLKLVSMRGAETFFHNTRLLVEIIRSDIGLAIDRNTKPRLFAANNIPWSLRPARAVTPKPSNTGLNRIRSLAEDMSQSLDRRLFDILMATSEFCSTINAISAGQETRMPEETFLHYMGSISYRLLNQDFKTGSLDEVVRLGLLAFVSPIFRNWNRVELPDDRFNQTYKDALASLAFEDLEIEPPQRLWLFMIGALSMCHDPDSFLWLEPWLQVNMRSCCIDSWDAMKDLLSKFLWVESIYDEQGREITDSILSGRRVMVQTSNCELIRSPN